MRPLVDFPAVRETPDDVRRHLREIDPTFELVWVPNVWMLGRVRPTRLRHAMAGRMLRRLLASEDPDPAAIAQARLGLQGFATTEIYPFHEADSRIVADARLRIWNLHHRADPAFRERLDETQFGPGLRARQAQMTDRVRSLSSGIGGAYNKGFQAQVVGKPIARRN